MKIELEVNPSHVGDQADQAKLVDAVANLEIVMLELCDRHGTAIAIMSTKGTELDKVCLSKKLLHLALSTTTAAMRSQNEN